MVMFRLSRIVTPMRMRSSRAITILDRRASPRSPELARTARPFGASRQSADATRAGMDIVPDEKV